MKGFLRKLYFRTDFFTLFVAVVLGATFFLVFLGMIGCQKASPDSKPQKSQLNTEQTDQFVEKLIELRKDPEKSSEYLRIIDKLSVLVRKEAETNPQRMKPFLEGMVGIAVKSGPGLALQVEDYANDVIKKRMTRLREESSVIQLERQKQIKVIQDEKIAELRKQIAALQEIQKENNELSNQINRFQSQLVRAEKNGKEKDKKIAELRKQIAALQEIQKENNELSNQINRLQSQLVRAEKDGKEKDKKIAELKKHSPPSDKDGVPVALIDAHEGGLRKTNLRIQNESTGQVWFEEGIHDYKVINLPPGKYKIEEVDVSGLKVYGSTEEVVSRDPSIKYRGKWCHGYFVVEH